MIERERMEEFKIRRDEESYSQSRITRKGLIKPEGLNLSEENWSEESV